MSVDAALYLLGPDDAAHARLIVAGRPVAFRALVAALRGGAGRVALPGILRTPELLRTIARSPRARQAVVWLDQAAPPEPPLVLVPATVVVPAPALALVLAASPPAVLGESRATGAPIALVDEAVWARVGAGVAAGAPLGDSLPSALGATASVVGGANWCVSVAGVAEAAEAEARLWAGLGSPIDTRLDVLVHRRLSRPATRIAIALGISPNQITLASLAVGLAAVAGFWGATPASALVGLALYVAAVVLDHADGEVARLTLTESRAGEWLDIAADTVIHALLVVALGAAAQVAAGGGAELGLVAAAGVVAGAVLGKLRPPAPARDPIGGVLERLSSRDGFYALLLAFVALLAVAPAGLPWLMLVVAAGAHAFWLARLSYLALRRFG